MMFSQCNTQWLYTLYDTISMGVWPHRGPCLLRFIYETCVLEFHVYIIMSLIITWSHAP